MHTVSIINALSLLYAEHVKDKVYLYLFFIRIYSSFLQPSNNGWQNNTCLLVTPIIFLDRNSQQVDGEEWLEFHWTPPHPCQEFPSMCCQCPWRTNTNVSSVSMCWGSPSRLSAATASASTASRSSPGRLDILEPPTASCNAILFPAWCLYTNGTSFSTSCVLISAHLWENLGLHHSVTLLQLILPWLDSKIEVSESEGYDHPGTFLRFIFYLFVLPFFSLWCIMNAFAFHYFEHEPAIKEAVSAIHRRGISFYKS